MIKSKSIVTGLPKYFLIVSLIVFLVLVLYFISPFLGSVIIAAVIATGCYPLQKALIKKAPRHPTLISLLTLLIVTVSVLTPITLFFSWIASQTGHAYLSITQNVNDFFRQDFRFLPDKIQNSFLGHELSLFSQYIPISAEDISRNIQDVIGRISAFIVSETTTVLQQFSFILLQLIVFFLSLFYFFRDGEQFIDTVRSLLPLPQRYRSELFSKLTTLSQSIIYGVIGGALTQGFFGGLGFYLAGVPNAAFWGSMMAFLSPVPYVGTAIIWVPTLIYMVVQGSLWPALFLLPWCLIVVGTSDNIVKPYLIGEANAIHPLLVLLVILGGIFVFGLKGVVFGPFLLSLFLTFLHIYSLEYREVLGR